MGKRGGFPGGMGGFGGMNINNLMKEAKKMQADIEKSQAEITAKNKEVVDPDDVEMLQDLVTTCVNEALRKVDEEQALQMGRFNIPGL